VDEGENFNRGEMLLLLTRMGENTRYFILGSEQQCDRIDIRREGGSGMLYALRKLRELDEIAGVEFTDDDVVRNPLIGKILKLWD
jgi:phosphate starvation-inducible PhoH-like protein